MNPITQAIKDLDPTYEITPMQALRIKESRDTVGVANILRTQVESNRQRIADGVGVPVEFVTVGDGLSAAYFTSPVSAQSDPERVAGLVTPGRIMEIGRRYQASLFAQKPTGPFIDLYREILKREPDAAGLAFYERKYAEGTELWVIAQDITESEEATS